ncbi:MAG: chemotaxis response regulator protein-glutamate methylesterase [Methylophaga sp.]|nr:chemotaxis response regulator protein-glutamate methylesterase [Methylophaga sp.]
MTYDNTRKISVLVVDDSALVRKLLSEILNSDDEINVVATATDPYDAREKIKAHNPDVLTLDVEMPKMDGITFLSNLMRLRPMPVVMISTLTEKGAETTLRALELGAVDFIEKPKLDLNNSLASYAEEIIVKVKTAAKANLNLRKSADPKASDTTIAKLAASGIAARSNTLNQLKTTEKIIAIGASTGGTEAIKEVLCAMPPVCPGIVVTQHIPAMFSAAFAQRINNMAQISVKQAEDGDPILPGHAYIAPGDKHLKVERSGARYLCRLDDGPPVSRHKPSVDVLFNSVAENVARNAIGVMLTGMGSDGAEGMLKMKEAGASNLVQDEKTSVVWGMPGSAFKLGAAEKQFPLDAIAAELIALSQK